MARRRKKVLCIEMWVYEEGVDVSMKGAMERERWR